MMVLVAVMAAMMVVMIIMVDMKSHKDDAVTHWPDGAELIDHQFESRSRRLS